MRCSACDRPMALTDMASRLHARLIVHRECYVETTGHEPPLRLTLADTLRLDGRAAA